MNLIINLIEFKAKLKPINAQRDDSASEKEKLARRRVSFWASSHGYRHL